MLKTTPIIVLLLSVELSLQDLKLDSKCPDKSVISPCTCRQLDGGWGYYTTYLTCGGNDQVDLKKIASHFERISGLEISNPAITSIEKGDFSRVGIQRLEIHDNPHLAKIDHDAFNRSSVIEFYFSNNPLISSKQAFDLANSFTTVGTYSFGIVDVIPTDSLHTKQGLITTVNFLGQKLTTIEPRAFIGINKTLLMVNFIDTSIESIPDNAFQYNVNDSDIQITLRNNAKLSGQSFATNSLKVGQNTASSVVFEPMVAYLDEKAFKTFFDQNPKNYIEIRSGGLNCNDKKNDWLKESSYVKRIKGFNC